MSGKPLVASLRIDPKSGQTRTVLYRPPSTAHQQEFGKTMETAKTDFDYLMRQIKGLGGRLFRMAGEADQRGDEDAVQWFSDAHEELIAWRKKWFGNYKQS